MQELMYSYFPNALMKDDAVKCDKNGFMQKMTTIEKQNVINLFSEAKPIIFSKDYGQVIASNHHEIIRLNDRDDSPLSIPFKTCLIECVGTPFKKDERTGFLSVLINEISFRKYQLYILVWDDNDNKLKIIDVNETPAPTFAFVRAFLKILDDRASRMVGIENINQVGKIKITGEKFHYRIRKLVHIKPKISYYEKTYASRQIDWSHRWQVMGHWRRITGLGKNRDGEYVVPNFTWVIEHEKGPENKLLVKKNRILDSLKTDCVI